MKPDFENLTEYVVIYLEDGESLQFHCWAEDVEHAIEQQDNAYPGTIVEAVWKKEKFCLTKL